MHLLVCCKSLLLWWCGWCSHFIAEEGGFREFFVQLFYAEMLTLKYLIVNAYTGILCV